MKLRRAAGWLLGAVMAVGIAQWPVTTRVGVNFHAHSKRIPLYEKVIHFIDRHLQTRRLSREITQGISGDEEKILTVFFWVTQNIQPVPPGFPVVDDHLLNVFIRGYGASDQRTEAFTLLVSYSGFQATAVYLRETASARVIPIAFVRLGQRTLLFDVGNKLLFQDERGRLLTLQDLIEDPRRIRGVSQGRTVHGVPYEAFFLGLRHIHPSFNRMEEQKPFFRMKSELLKVSSASKR